MLVLVVCLLPAIAAADPAAPAADGLTPLERRVAEDAAGQRAYLAETALVAPAGSTTFTVQAPLAPAVSLRIDRSLSDRLSLGAGVVAVMADGDSGGLPALFAKYQLWRGRRAALALTGSFYTVVGRRYDGSLEVEGRIAVPGIAASWCADDDCRTLISVDGEAIMASPAPGDDGDGRALVAGASLINGGRRRFLLEVHTATDDGLRGVFGFVGARFLIDGAAFDAGAGFVVGADEYTEVDDVGDIEIGAYPVVALSVRR